MYLDLREKGMKSARPEEVVNRIIPSSHLLVHGGGPLLGPAHRLLSSLNVREACTHLIVPTLSQNISSERKVVVHTRGNDARDDKGIFVRLLPLMLN